MSKNIKNIVAAVFSFILIAAVIGGVYAFTNNHTPEKHKRASNWYFTGNQSQMLDTAFWNQEGTTGCGPSGNSPCTINVEAENKAELDDILQDEGTSGVLALSPQRRP